MLELADRGGYDAVQLRDVSLASGVSTATIYKYFGGRDQLLLTALLEWRRAVHTESTKRAATKDSFEQRILAPIRYIFEDFEEHPHLFATFIHVCQVSGSEAFERQGLESMAPVASAELASLDPDFAADFSMIVGNAAYAAIARAASGEIEIGRAWTELERTVHRLTATLP